MFEKLTEKEALVLIKRSNTAHEDVYTIRRLHAQIFGELSTPAILSRIIYWSGKSSLEDGWFYKTADELAAEVCLSRSTIMRAKEKLEQMRIIETKSKSVDGVPVLHWRLVAKNLLDIEVKYLDSHCVNLTQCIVSNWNNPIIQKDNIHIIDILSEGGGKKEKKKETKKPAFIFELPEWVPVEPWEAYVEQRKKMGAFTEYAKKLQVMELKKIMDASGGSAEEIINQSVRNSWKGLFPLQRNGGAGGKGERYNKGERKEGGNERRGKYSSLDKKTDVERSS